MFDHDTSEKIVNIIAETLIDNGLEIEAAHEQAEDLLSEAGWLMIDLLDEGEEVLKEFIGDHGKEHAVHVGMWRYMQDDNEYILTEFYNEFEVDSDLEQFLNLSKVFSHYRHDERAVYYGNLIVFPC